MPVCVHLQYLRSGRQCVCITLSDYFDIISSQSFFNILMKFKNKQGMIANKQTFDIPKFPIKLMPDNHFYFF